MSHRPSSLRRRLVALPAAAALAGAAGIAALPSIASAQTWPERPIRYVVPYPPSGPLDLVARALAEKLDASLGQRVIVENKPGAGGNIGADLVAKAQPDGYTIVMGAVATHAINPYLYAKMPYDANADFAPITRIASVPNVLVMNPETARKLGVNNVADLIAYAKRNPGKLNYASGSNGSAGHLAGELLESMAGIAAVHIPYKGAAPAQLSLLSGETDFLFDNLASAAPQIRAGKLKALAVTTTERSSFFPELPTMSESGLKGFDIDTWFGVFAPASTPKPVVDRLHDEFARALANPEIVERLSKMGAKPAPMSPQAFGEFVRAEQKKYAKIVKASGARVD
ncbi:MAG: tripartite tricarboxylate transporter substrate binding protein [Burkholderiaceae bacterium]|jgi:tripartite-type tricarboxylate transporter receptor subunit TctC|nr:tripartite tricarboxylate transporter substrate binding protein [Burkholderiaceae bacterium]